MEKEIFKSLTLLRGDKVDVLICRGVNISRVSIRNMFHNQMNSNEDKLDVIPFYMSELCLINGSKKDINYFLELLSDDYMLIADSLVEVLESILK